MQHERVFERTIQGINDLSVTLSTQRSHHQGLGFTAGKQRRTMCSWQYAGANRNRTNGFNITAVDTWLASQNTTTNRGFLDFLDGAFYSFDIPLWIITFAELTHHACLDFINLGITIHLVSNLVGSNHVITNRRFNCIMQCCVNFGFSVWNRSLIDFSSQFFDSVDGNLLLFMTKQNGTQHFLFSKAIGF